MKSMKKKSRNIVVFINNILYFTLLFLLSNYLHKGNAELLHNSFIII